MGFIAPISNYQSQQYQIYDQLASCRTEIAKAGAISKILPIRRQFGASGDSISGWKSALPVKTNMRTPRFIANMTGLGKKIDIKI
ncbi:hypothetical protein BpJC7_17900 [Weizmannia acidilactici]|uniref:Uncharacterized protein n=1 Tax=Weizmannia acidilactici TaxID=2607726 RepID=A0A5J4JJF1_9BACI|nr:hypothetical protein [Weizmannia acidilactici]GER67388.1 hypothetical protein BpJC4_18590 [Weizmannia acidilactici]GER70487.1 hypothetical protein BpJC7_17900 [Weizmannia acidilactici]GER72612.1 hypothetical protein BpPP18_06790 [Weizmannia acidilactici]